MDAANNFPKLLEKALGKDREAIAELAENYEKLMRGWIKEHDQGGDLTRGEHRESDILQEFFLRLLTPKSTETPDERETTTKPPAKKSPNRPPAKKSQKKPTRASIEKPVSYTRQSIINQGKIMRRANLAEKRGGGRKAAVNTSFFASFLATQDSVSQLAIGDEFRQRFEAVLKTLPVDKRTFFEACVNRTGWASIAKQTGLEEDTARKRFEKLAAELLELANFS